MASSLLLLVLLVEATLHEAAAQASTNFSYNNFLGLAANELQRTGDAEVTNGELWLTGDRFSSYGRVMKPEKVQFCNLSTGEMASFSTNFTFVIKKKNPDPTVVNADGFAFLIAPDLTPPSNKTFGRWLGLFEPEKNGMSSNNLVAVEFDTYENRPPKFPEFQDIDNNHVGVDVNGIISINASSLHDYGVTLGSGFPITARISYNAPLQRLQVYVSTDIGNMRSPVLDHSINLCAYIDDFSYVGFSGGAGSGNVDFHIIKSWKFSSSFSKIVATNNAPASSTPPPIFRTLFSIAVSCASVLLLTIG